MASSENHTEEPKKALCRQVSLIDAKDQLEEDTSHSKGVLNGLLQQFKDEKFCDVTLVFGKKEIKAHRVVLASSSQYFEAMFSANFIDVTQQRLEIPVLGESIGEALIEFAYSGKIQITYENVVDLLAGANFLQGFEFVEKSCSDYLKQYTGKHNIFQIIGIADRYNQKDLTTTCKKFIIRNFVDCVESDNESFVNIHEDLLIDILSSNELLVVVDSNVYLGRIQEEFLLKKVFEFLDHNQDRKLKIKEILKCIHLPLLKKQSLQALKSNPLLKNTDCLEVIEKALNLKKSKKSATEKSRSDWAKRRQCGEYQLWKGRCLANGGQVNTIEDTFDDKDKISIDKDYVVGMEFWIRRWDGRPVLGGLKVHYSNGQKIMHGSSKGEQKEEFTLEQNEKIVKIDSQSGWMVDNLAFYTTSDRKLGPFGGPGGGFRHEKSPGCYGYLAYINGTIVNTQNDLGITNLQFVWRFFRLPGEKHVPDYVEPDHHDIYDEFDYDDYDDYDDYLDYDEFPDDYDPDYDDWADGYDLDGYYPGDLMPEGWDPHNIQPYQFEPLADPTDDNSAPEDEGNDDDECSDCGAPPVHQSSHDADDEHTADDCCNLPQLYPEHGSDCDCDTHDNKADNEED